MINRTIFLTIISFIIYSGGICFAPYAFTADSPDGLRNLLTNKQMRALKAEMNAIQNGTTNIAIAIPAGRIQEVADTARQIREGYVLKRILSQEDLRELRNKLPREYAVLDRNFLAAADRLRAAAEQKDLSLASSFFHELNEQCALCHDRYARERFPEFKQLQLIK